MKNAILCGYHWTGCKALDMLLNNNYNVYVYTHENPYYVNSLKLFCEKKNVGYSFDKIKINNLPFKPDIICSIYYRNIIHCDVINYCDGKIFNLHPSLLPKYRGCSSLTWAMINGEEDVGFTFHYLRKTIDGGNIILQKKIKIEEFDTQQTLYDRVMFESMKYFEETLRLVEKGYKGKHNKISELEYYKRGCPYNGEIDANWDINKIERFIRAMICPPLPVAKLIGKEIKTIEEYLKYQGKCL